MKKLFAILLAFALAAGLSACAGRSAELNQEPLGPVDTPTTEEVIAASESSAAAIAEATPPASGTDAAVDEAAYDTAMTYIGRSAAELYGAIGEPDSAQYAASCEEENAEDGMLFYDGFYVWTVRTQTQELIHDVYLMD